MARRRVTALFMREDDLRAVDDLLIDPAVSGSVVVCDVEEEAIPRLGEAGLFLQQVGAPAEEPEASRELSRTLGMRPAATPHAPAGVASEVDLELPALDDVYLLEIAGSLLPAWGEQLAAAGARLLERTGEAVYTARIRLEDVAEVSDLPMVRSLRHYSTADTMHREQLEAAERAVPITWDVVLHTPESSATVRGWLEEHDMPVVGAAGRTIRMRAPRGAADLRALARLPDVAAIDEWVQPTLANERARMLLHLVDEAGQPVLPWTGRDQVVAIADSGVDAEHPDLRERLVAVIPRGVPGDPSDRHGHGTHVAGSIAGAGQTVQGAAPDARLVFQAVMDEAGDLSLPVDLGELFEEARARGAYIHNNSWSALAGSAYRSTSLMVDAYARDHLDMLIVIAAGNDGTAKNPRNAQPGFVDLFSVGAPATAKNALTVGASRSNRPWAPAVSWAGFDESRFADSPIGTELVTGDAESLAAFSGRGPCEEQVRIKPDLVAPGTFILSTRASGAPEDSFWAPESERYAYMGGTSMAAPLVAGCAAIVRQYYVEERDHTPSAALLKATLVNGTRRLTGADASADVGQPSYHQGFGIVDMRTTLPGPHLPRLDFVDDWERADGHLAYTGDSRTFVFELEAGQPLRLCLAWTDRPGRNVQNNLSVLLAHDDSGQRWSGNAGRTKQFDTEDTGNNVHVIRLEDGPAGPYVVQVVAGNLLARDGADPYRTQPFALVVGGDLVKKLTAV
jgi:serine protease AprX